MNRDLGLWITVIGLLVIGSFLMASRCDAWSVELPEPAIEPFFGLHFHIVPIYGDEAPCTTETECSENGVKLVDAIGGINLINWYLNLGIGATTYTYGLVVNRKPWELLPVYGYAHIGRRWGMMREGESPWAFGAGVMIRW